MRIFAAAAIAWMMFAPTAQAEITAASPSAFLLQYDVEIAKSPGQVWRDLQRIDRWWNAAHTYSGNASNLSLESRAGGCWCERWGNRQSVEHARVVAVIEHEGVRTLRLIGGLGPLQDMGVTGVMTFTVSPLADGAKVTVTYRVSGDPGLNLDAIASPVDGVLSEQIQRFSRYSSGTLD